MVSADEPDSRISRGVPSSTRAASATGPTTHSSGPRSSAPVSTPMSDAHEQRLVWANSFRRVGLPEYVVLGATAGLLGALQWAIPPVTESGWNGPILFDQFARDTLLASSRRGRNVAGYVSDGLAYWSIAHNVLIDNAAVVWWGDRNPDVAWQMLVINAQAYALATLSVNATKRFARRARPYAAPCDSDPNYSSSCAKEEQHRSFYSGHSSQTGTSAGLMCAHHTHLPLYGGGATDVAACVAALAYMATTGALRIRSDNHWASDVVVGHLTGFAWGYLLPTFLYYRGPRVEPIPERATRWTVLPVATQQTLGVQAVGLF